MQHVYLFFFNERRMATLTQLYLYLSPCWFCMTNLHSAALQLFHLFPFLLYYKVD